MSKEFIRVAQLELTLEEYKEGEVTREIQNLISSIKAKVEMKKELTYRTDIGEDNTLYIGVEKSGDSSSTPGDNQ